MATCRPSLAWVLPLLVVTCVAFPGLADEALRGPSIGWDAVGPERGHVIDAAVGLSQIVVVTRVGVQVADLTGDEGLVWRRDPRFPRNTRRIEAGTNGTWWSTAQSSVCYTSDEGTTCLAVAAESFPVAVSPSPLGEGIAVVAVRGRTPGVLLVGTDDSAPVTVLSDVDPWCVITRGEQVWVGTLGQGLWVSNDGGLTFTEAVPGASVPALDIVGETLLMGLRDGSVLAPVTGATMGTVAPGWAIDFASAGDELLVLSASTDGPERLWRGDGSSLSPVALPSVDDDPSQVNLTGLWPLPDGTVLVGTFRRGPLIYDKGEFRTGRQSFRASNVRGAARWGDGLMVAMMGTGVYLSNAAADQWAGHHRFPGPVTDTVALSKDGSAVIAVDFDGVVRFDASGQWTRTSGVRDPAAHSPNGLIDVRVDDEGRWWGLTESRRLMLLGDQGWSECSERGARRLDGSAEHLMLLTSEGFYSLDSCQTPGTRIWPDVPMPPGVEDARADAGWLAVPGALYRDGARFANLPIGRPEAIAGGADECLVVIAHVVLACKDGACEPVGVPFGESSSGVGWLDDGRVWYAEAMGTVWASGGTETPIPCSTVVASPTPGEAPWSILRLPWSMEGRRSEEAPPKPGSRNDSFLPPGIDGRRGLVGLLVVVAAVVVLLTGAAVILIRYRRKRGSESTDS